MLHNLIIGSRNSVPLPKFQMVPILRFVTLLGSKKKEPRYACLSEAKAPHSHRTWTEVSSSVPHFLQVGFQLNPITFRYLLRVLSLVRRLVMTLDCVLLKDCNRVFVAVLRPEINFRACVLVQGPCHPLCNRIIDILPRDPKGWLRSYKLLSGAIPCELISDLMSTYPGMSRDPVQPHNVPGRKHACNVV